MPNCTDPRCEHAGIDQPDAAFKVRHDGKLDLVCRSCQNRKGRERYVQLRPDRPIIRDVDGVPSKRCTCTGCPACTPNGCTIRPLESFREGRGLGGHVAKCLLCERRYNSIKKLEYRLDSPHPRVVETRDELAVGMRTCSVHRQGAKTACGRTFPLTAEYFRIRPTNRNGFSTACIECEVKYDRIRGLAQHHLTIAGYDALLARQGGKCPVCNEAPPFGVTLSVDHDHSCCPGYYSCGRCIRGLLCPGHNNALGLFHDSIIEMRRAIDYLRTPTLPL